jgi:hypothetical protein
MNTKFLRNIIGATLLAVALPAFAATDDMGNSQSGGTGLFLEPGISYQNTSSNVDYGAGVGNSSANSRGFGVLVRGGIHVYERFFVAADARYAMLKFSDNSNNLNADATSWDVAPTVGMQMPDWGARFYVGYVLAGEMDPRSANSLDAKFEDPTGWRVGAGLKAKHLSVNIEWQRLHYGKGSLTRSPATTLDSLKYNAEGLIASITFPIEFN